MNLPAIEEVSQIVRQAAREELLPRFTRVERGLKADGSVITEADLAMQQRLQTQLSQRWPRYRFMGEEMAASKQEAMLADTHDGLWCLDPLDGTSNFAAGIPFFSVSLSLIQEGEVVVGVVYDPMLDECFCAVRGQGARLNGEPLRPPAPPPLQQCTALIDFKRLAPELAQRLVTERPYSSQRSFGSVALDWCWIAAGRCHIYLHGKQSLWDYSAGSLILQEAGGHAITLEGETVMHPSLAPRSAVAASDANLFRAWGEWLEIDMP